MTIDTTPLKKVIKVWRDLNAERSEAMANGDDVDVIAKLNADELFRLRDIAGEAMQLVDEIEMFTGASLLRNSDGQPLVAVKVGGDDDGETA